MTIPRFRKRLAVAVLGLAVTGTLVAASISNAATESIGCSITDSTLTCPLPPAPTTTVTSTETVTAAPAPTVTVTATTTVTATPAPTTSTPTPTSSTPSPTPTTSTTPPPPGAFPTAATTGVPAGTVLKSPAGVLPAGALWSNGVLKILAQNVTLDGYDINGPLDGGSQTGLIVKNSKIRATGENDWCVDHLAAGATVQDSEIGGGADGKTFMHCIGAYVGAPANFIRDNVHHVMHGFRDDAGLNLQDSYVHDLAMGDNVCGIAGCSTGNHTDGAMSTGSNPAWFASGAIAPNVINHNTFAYANTALIFGQNSNTQLGPQKITNNYFVGVWHNTQQASFAVSIENKGINQSTGHITVTGNTFDRRATIDDACNTLPATTCHNAWQVGAMQVPAGSTTSGNVYTDGSLVSVGTS